MNKEVKRLDVQALLLKNKQILCVLLLAAGLLLCVFNNFFKLRARQFSFWNMNEVSVIFLIFALAAIIVISVIGVYISKKEVNICKLYLFSIVVLGLAYIVIFPPFTVPDEPVHYFSAYRISNYFLLNFDQAGQSAVMVRQSDADFYTNIGRTALSAEYYHKINNSLQLFSRNNELTLLPFDMITTAPLGYLFSGIGIAFARLFRLSPLLTFYIGRVVNVFVYAAITYYAMKIASFGKMAIFAISALPMSLHLIASYSYDYLTLAVSIMFVSQILYMREKKEQIKISEILLCGLWGAILAPSKIVYVPMLLLVFIIPKEKFNCSAKKAFLIKSGIALLGVALVLIIQGSTLLKTAVGQDSTGWSGTELYSVSWIIQNPFEALKIIAATIFNKAEFYLKTLVGGSLGWFQIYVPLYCYLPFFFILGYCFMRRDNETAIINFNKKLFVLFIILVVSFLILLSMFIAWTPINSPVIEGVQGRYFLPLLPAVYLLLRNKIVSVKSSYDKYMIYFILCWNLFSGVEYFVGSFI